MRPFNFVLAIANLSMQSVLGARIILSNDDGWADLYVREFYDSLTAAGNNVILSCPADNKSGSGSRDANPVPRTQPCQYDSCPAGSGPIGVNASNPHLNWVNSYPVTAMRIGISTLSTQFWNGQPPDIAVAGPNVGSNLWPTTRISGTVGAAVYAAHDAGVPAIAFSGASGGALPWNTTQPPARSLIYAELARQLTEVVLASGNPYLPHDVWLNVNFPRVEGKCAHADDFKWVLSRINPGIFSNPDVRHCCRTMLPTETEVIGTNGCYISVSVGNASDKTTASEENQAVVLQKLRGILTCLPT